MGWVLAAGATGVAWVVFVWVCHPFTRGAHTARRRHLEPRAVPVLDAGSMTLEAERAFEGLPPWAAPEADRYSGYGWASGSMGSDYGSYPSEAALVADLEAHGWFDPDVQDRLQAGLPPDDWSAADLAALHDAPTVLDDSPPRQPSYPDEPGEDGQILVWHGDGFVWEDPPAPTRLLRTTGELFRADLLADAVAFMNRQDAEVLAWLAGASERWAAA